MALVKRLATLMVSAGLLALPPVQTAQAADAAVKSVSLVSIVEHPALDAVRDGVQEALKEAGYNEGKNLKWQYQSAQGNVGTAAQIARKFIGDRPDAIVAVGTPAAQSVAAATREIPIVYCAVTDPVEARLVPTWEKWDGNVTGVSDRLDMGRQIELIRQIVPQVKTVGVVYNPGEANSVAALNRLKEMLAQQDIQLIEAAAPRTVDVSSAARRLVGKVDVLYSTTDNNVVSAYESLVKVANESKVPLIASDSGSVTRGAIAALGVDYHDLGMQAGKQVIRILNGEKAGDIPSQSSENLQLLVNPSAAKRQGVTLSDEFIKSAAEVVGE